MPTAYDVDLYSDAVIAEPYAHYQAIRDRGPAVWLPRHDLYAIGRFADVRAVLRDYRTFSSASGVAANDEINTLSRGTTLMSDPPEHRTMREIIRAPLTPPALQAVEPRIRHEAETLVDRLVARGSFDAIADLARHLPVTIVSDLVGLPEEGRGNMLRWAAATFDALGVMNDRGRAAMPQIQELRRYCTQHATPEKLRPDGWAAAIWRAAGRGEIDPARCPAMMRDYIGPSLDTTIFAIGNLVMLFGQNPAEWDRVRADPALVPGAINEAIRLESPIRGFTRLATRDCEIDGTPLPAGARVLALYASANRDERKWAGPERFDVRRDVRDHLGFGFGLHVCAGTHLARMEIAALVTALARTVERFELGAPVRAPSNVLRGLASLPVRVHRVAVERAYEPA